MGSDGGPDALRMAPGMMPIWHHAALERALVPASKPADPSADVMVAPDLAGQGNPVHAACNLSRFHGASGRNSARQPL
ncbi:hypothetical protein SXCC_04384 [Gluconacetobacter sp. SXCC-1]|nr:hypothetical protein SXCC_04384 [Gluconacetobacter sp. SXCC-1]